MKSLLLCAPALAIAIAGCNKPSSPPPTASSSSNANVASAPKPSAPTPAAPSASSNDSSAGATIADFPTKDASVWVNGPASMLADAKGDVVLVEAWHRL